MQSDEDKNQPDQINLLTKIAPHYYMEVCTFVAFNFIRFAKLKLNHIH